MTAWIRTGGPRWPAEPSLNGYQRRKAFRGIRVIARLAGIFFVLVPLLTLIIAGVAVPVTRVALKAAEPYTNLTLPSEAPEGPQTTFVYDRDGKLIARLHAGVNRTVVPGDQIPQAMRDAVVASEDKDFYKHGGIDTEAIARAALADITHRQIEQGGSTITQQYVKNVYTGSERSFERKIKEAILAQQLEDELPKEEILVRYLNTVYFGNGAYGVEAAAETYFARPAQKLSILQSATLAGLIPAPSRYDPVTNPDGAVDRRNRVLQAMAQQGYITAEKAEKLEQRPLKLHPPKKDGTQTSYFVDWVSHQLVEKYGYDATFSGGLRVTTTIDSDYQRAAEEAVATNLSEKGDPSAALVAIDPRTGAVRAMVGGSNFEKKKFNLALQAHRNTGSAFKTFTLMAALQQHISLNSKWHGTPQLVIDDPRCLSPKEEPWEVHTYEDESFGTMDLVRATQYSVNTVFAQLVLEVGPDEVAKVAKRMGIKTKLEPVCSITLGSQSVTPMDMTTAYATLAARGERHWPQPIQEIRSPDDQTIEKLNPNGKQVLDQNDADTATYVLEHVITSGTGTRANIGRPAAGKTGTAQEYRDAWFCGYIPQLAACVWVGYPKGEISLHNIEGFANVFGGSIPAMIWHDFMAKVTPGIEVATFVQPDLSVYDVFPEGTRSAPPPSSSASESSSSGPGPGPGHGKCHPWKPRCHRP